MIYIDHHFATADVSLIPHIHIHIYTLAHLANVSKMSANYISAKSHTVHLLTRKTSPQPCFGSLVM